MLSLKQKACKLGKSMSINTEHHGDDDVGAIDIPIDGIMLTAAELDTLCGDGSHAALFVKEKGASLPEPRFMLFKPFGFKQKFEKAKVTVHVGMSPEKLAFQGCKIGSVMLTPQTGGLTMMSCSIRARPETDDVGTLFENRNGTATLWISGAERVEERDERQRGLGLGEPKDDDDNETREPVH